MNAELATVLAQLPPGVFVFLVIVMIWSFIWKGFALWRAGRLNQPVWFVVILFLNTLGILEILYLFVFSKSGKKSRRR